MLKSKVFANAAAVVMGAWVVFCGLLSYIAPNFLFAIAQSWMHNINLEPVRTTFNPNLGSLLFGFVSAVSPYLGNNLRFG